MRVRIRLLTERAPRFMLYDGRQMLCKEKRSLVDAYKTTTAVHELNKNIATIGQDEYRDLQKIADDTRLQCERARAEFDEHVHSHGC
jgi:hypothetical protein